MLTETIYHGRNNSFSLQLFRGGVNVNLLSITGYSLHLSEDLVFSDMTLFTEKEDGVVEMAIGDLLTEDDMGTYKAYLVTYDPMNIEGVRWPTFKLKVLE